nr:uncharacterized protein LOC128706479 [Cherax quadricarinatus]
MRPRKQRCIPTPSTTPASSHTKDATSTLAHKKQKLHSPASKKCLTFADVPFHLPEHSGKDDQMQSQGMKQGNFVSDSANCKLLTVHSGRKSRSLSSSKSSVYNADRSRKTCHSQSSASKKEEPLPKQLQHSPTLRNTNEELNKDSYYLTACSEYADSNTHNLNFKEGENRSLKRSHSDLGLNTINCIKTKIFHVSNDHQHSNIAANFPTSEVYDNFNQPSKDEGVESTTSGNSQSTYITSNILYKRAGNFSTEQQGFFNFLSENGEKQSLPFLCGTEICTPPRYPRKSLPFSSPSDFLTKFAPADTYKLSGTSSAENPLSQEDCKIPDHLQGSAKSGIETNLSDLSLLPSKIGISTGVDEDPVCNEDFKELCEYKFQEKSYLGYYTNIPVQRPPNVIQQLHTLALKTDTPKQPPASVQSALPLQLETASIKSHMLDKQPNVISIQYNREGNSFRCGQQISVNRQLPLNDLSQDLQPGTTNPLVEIPIRSYLRSPNPLVSQNLELGTSEVGTPKPALKVNVAFSPTETLECFETESFITPVGRHYILPVEAPRKTLHPTTRQHPPRCRRSLARLFDEKDACVTPVADTPPDTPNR